MATTTYWIVSSENKTNITEYFSWQVHLSPQNNWNGVIIIIIKFMNIYNVYT